jgi:hypothetical protein
LWRLAADGTYSKLAVDLNAPRLRRSASRDRNEIGSVSGSDASDDGEWDMLPPELPYPNQRRAECLARKARKQKRGSKSTPSATATTAGGSPSTAGTPRYEQEAQRRSRR